MRAVCSEMTVAYIVNTKKCTVEHAPAGAYFSKSQILLTKKPPSVTLSCTAEKCPELPFVDYNLDLIKRIELHTLLAYSRCSGATDLTLMHFLKR